MFAQMKCEIICVILQFSNKGFIGLFVLFFFSWGDENISDANFWKDTGFSLLLPDESISQL